MDYHRWKTIKRRMICVLSIISSVMLCSSAVIYYWAELTLPAHKYIPQIGEYIGPTNVTSIHLGLFTTSLGSYASLFNKPDTEETQKINIVATFILLSVFSTLTAGLMKILAPIYCRLAKRYKCSALLNVLSVVLNIGALVVWFWFTHGFTHGRYTLGAEVNYSCSVFVMLSSCGLLIFVIALDFISCKRRTLQPEYPISPAGSVTSDVAPVNLSPDEPPPYQPL